MATEGEKTNTNFHHEIYMQVMCVEKDKQETILLFYYF